MNEIHPGAHVRGKQPGSGSAGGNWECIVRRVGTWDGVWPSAGTPVWGRWVDTTTGAIARAADECLSPDEAYPISLGGLLTQIGAQYVTVIRSEVDVEALKRWAMEDE